MSMLKWEMESSTRETTFANRPGYGIAAIFRRCPTNCTRAVISARQRTSFEPNFEGIEELFASKETAEVPQKPVEDLTADDIFLQSYPGLAQVWEEAQDKYYLNLLDTALNKLPKDIRNQTDKRPQHNRKNEATLTGTACINEEFAKEFPIERSITKYLPFDENFLGKEETLAPMLETSLLSIPFCPVN
ncbi:hypothetical protein Bbelb_317730 [Branchiostoma belcheri]|nr:hypothetical protein Bbelb_317730 [Branchiostoma belcheri]